MATGQYVMKISLLLLAVFYFAVSLSSHAAGNFTKIHESFVVLQNLRPGISEEGDIVAASRDTLFVGNDSDLSVVEIDLSSENYRFGDANLSQSIHIRNGREIVFLAFKDDPSCSDFAGVYRRLVFSPLITPLLEGCRGGGSASDSPRYYIDMSSNGAVVVPSFFGLIMIGPSTGPLANPLDGTRIRYSTVGRVAVNDSEQIALQSETGGARRILFFSDSEDLTDFSTIATFSIANNPIVAVNNSGAIIFSINDNFTSRIGGIETSFQPGVYLSEPTAVVDERSLTVIADNSGDFCYFGAVTINDSGHYAFSAQLRSEITSRCSSDSGMDGVFNGDNPIEDIIVASGNEDLESHQFFDSVTLGYLNNRDELSFITSYSEPLVSPTYVWKANMTDAYRSPSLLSRFFILLAEIWQYLINWFNYIFS